MAQDPFRLAQAVQEYERSLRGRQDDYVGNDISLDLQGLLADNGYTAKQD